MTRPASRLRRMGTSVRKHRTFSTALALVAAFAAFGAVLWVILKNDKSPGREAGAGYDAKDSWKSSQKDLALGRETVLVGEVGWPQWHECLLGKDGRTMSASDASPLSLETWSVNGPALVQLLPEEPACAGYVFRAQVRHNQAASWGDAGLGVLLAEETSANDTNYFVCALVFADHGPFAKPDVSGKPAGHLKLVLRHYGKNTPYQSNEAILLDLPFVPEKEVWRNLEVTVTREWIFVRGMGQSGKIKRQPLERTARSSLGLELKAKRLPPELAKLAAKQGKKPALNFREVLGLYVKNSAASFRNVHVQPLVDTP